MSDLCLILGKTVTEVRRIGDEEIYFTTTDGEIFLMYHSQDCCECVLIEDIEGDLQSLIGNPILVAEEVSQDDPSAGESGTWTFYKIADDQGPRRYSLVWFVERLLLRRGQLHQGGPMTFDPAAIATIGHNHPEEPPYLTIFQQIDDLFMEATNFADGEPIDSDTLADAMTALHDKLHALGKQADDLRVAEKRPLDEKVKEIQDRYNKYIQPKKGKVDLAKSALGTLLAAWRSKKAAAAKAEADRIAAEAEAARQAANAAIQASSGNLAARAEAEEALKQAKKLEKTAARSFKAATTGTGLRSVWTASIADEEKALEWAWGVNPDAFRQMALSLAQEKVRAGARVLPGFAIVEEKTASVRRAS